MKQRRRLLAGFGFVLGILALGSARSAEGAAASGWITLLDAATGLSRWNRVGDANWRLVDGVVQADQGGKEGGYLVSQASYRDLSLRVEFWASVDANSGVFIRCADPSSITPMNSYEVNIFDGRPDPSYGTGAIVDVAKVSPMPRAGGRWNVYEITAIGDQLTVSLNGVRTVSVRDGRFGSGPIALQYGQGIVKFRKVEIRPL